MVAEWERITVALMSNPIRPPSHTQTQVANAAAAQLLTLNTNSRYLHGALCDYTQELLATLPAPLQVRLFVL